MICKAHDDDRVERQWGSGIAQCQQCMTVFQVMENIRNAMTKGREDVGNVLDHFRDKMKLFMGYKLRFYIQERVIDEEYNYVLHQEEETTVVVY